MEHPVLGPLAKRYTDAHKASLTTVAQTMAAYTAEALKAQHYLATLRELLASERYVLLSCDASFSNAPDRVCVWIDKKPVMRLPIPMNPCAAPSIIVTGAWLPPVTDRLPVLGTSASVCPIMSRPGER
jgi:hypothetical protein